MSSCIFCRIVAKEIPATVVLENDDVIAFRDLNPVAPVHVLIIPKKHLGGLNDIEAADRERMGSLFLAAREVATQEGIAESGYRCVVNTGANAGQSVHHIHLHVIGKRPMSWPPG